MVVLVTGACVSAVGLEPPPAASSPRGSSVTVELEFSLAAGAHWPLIITACTCSAAACHLMCLLGLSGA